MATVLVMQTFPQSFKYTFTISVSMHFDQQAYLKFGVDLLCSGFTV